MKQLIEVIKIVVEKYMERVNLIIKDNELIFEYLYFINDEKDIYKTIEIEEFENKLKITIEPEKIIKIVDISYIDEMVQILEKQCQAKKLTIEEIKYIKDTYKEGMNVKLIKMYDFANDLVTGTVGVITAVDDIGTIHVNWNNGSTLGLVIGTDEFEVIEQ